MEILAKVLDTLDNDSLSGEAMEAYKRLKESVAEMCLRMKTKEDVEAVRGLARFLNQKDIGLDLHYQIGALFGEKTLTQKEATARKSTQIRQSGGITQLIKSQLEQCVIDTEKIEDMIGNQKSLTD